MRKSFKKNADLKVHIFRFNVGLTFTSLP
jgi:hypothetical protein